MSQTNVRFRDCQNCNTTSNNSNSPVNYNYGSVQEFLNSNVTSDYGPRSLGGYDFHGGVDFSTGGGSSRGDAILAMSNGTIKSLDNQGGIVSITIEASSFSYAYRHLFDGSLSNISGEVQSGKFILKKVNNQNSNRYTIIDTESMTAYGTLSSDTVDYNGQTLNIQNTVVSNSEIGPIGDSNGSFPPHIHIQGVQNSDISSSNGLYNDINSFNPLKYITSSSYPNYTGTLIENNGNNVIDLNYDGSNYFKLRVRMNDESLNSTGSYSNIFNLNDIRIEGATTDSYHVLKNSNNDDIRVNYGGDDIVETLSEPNWVGVDAINGGLFGSNNLTGVEPRAYSSGSYDNFFLFGFHPRVSSSTILGSDGLALINENALFLDGDLTLRSVVVDIYENEHINDLGNTILDNFLPYIKKVTLSDSEGVFYEAEWVLNGSGTELELDQCTYRNGITTGFNIQIETSETMNNLSMNLAGVPNNLISINSENTVWELQNPFTGNASSNQTITFTGSDTAGNSLLTDPSNLYWRTGNNTWQNGTTNQPITGNIESLGITGSDTIHRINMNVDCSDSCTDNYEPNNTQPDAFLLSSTGKDFSNYASIDACLSHNLIYEDWYVIGATAQGELNITLANQTDNFEIELFNEGSSTPFDQGVLQSNGDITLDWCSSSNACIPLYIRVFKEQFSTPSVNPNYNYNLILDWNYNQNCNTANKINTSNPPPQPGLLTITGNTNVCVGESTTLSVSGGSGNYQWFLNNSEIGTGTSITINNLNIGNNSINVVDLDSACNTGSTIINATQGVTANAGSNVTIQNGSSTTLQGSGGTSCSWSPTAGLSNPNSCTTTASPSQTTTYTLTVTENGCTDTDTVTVTVNGSSGGNEPVNDNCNDAITLTSNTSCNTTFGTIDYATDDGFPNDPSCDVHSNPNTFGVFYSFTAVSNTHNIVVDPTGQLDAVVTVYSGSNCYNLSEFDCEDTSGGNGVTTTLTNNNFVIGQQYWIRVYDYGNVEPPIGQGGFNICVTHTNTGNSDGTDLVSNITSVSNNNPDAGNPITINYSVTNIGDTATQYWIAPSFYLSTNTTLSGADDYLDSDTINQTISANETVNTSVSVTIPNVSDGQYYLVVNPDPANVIAESNESNNLDFYLIQIGNVADNGPDLDVTGLTVTPSTGLVPGQEVEIEIDIENEGNVDCNDFDVLVFLDINGNNEYDTNEFMGEFNFNGLDAGEEDTVIVDFNLPTNITSTGTYELFVLADSGNAINETNENNNDKDRNITIAIANDGSEDVSILNESVSPTTINAGGDVNVVVSHVYLGSQTDADLPSLDLGYYLSSDCQLSIDDILLEDEVSGLGSDDPIIEEDEILTIPLGTPDGIYYVLFVADMDNEVDEGVQENNNVECVEITVTNNNSPAGDIYITDQICTPYNVMAGNDVETFVNVHYSGNQLDADLPSFTLSFYLSTDCVFSNDDMFLDDTNISLGSDYPINDDTELNDLPANLSPGTYFIIFVADAENELYEVNENNNIACAEFQVFSANSNFQDVTLTNPYVDVTLASVGDQIYVSVFQNYTGYQTDSDLDSVQIDYYLSTDCVLSADDIFLDDDFSSIGNDDPSQFEDQTLTIPDVVGDDYYILFVADATNIVAENDETNNLECIPITIQESTLGIEETEVLNKIKIYPNPVSDVLTINLGEIHSKINIEIYNILGQRVNKLNFENKQTLTINTSSYANGMYFFKINTEKFKTQEFKIIKE